MILAKPFVFLPFCFVPKKMDSSSSFPFVSKVASVSQWEQAMADAAEAATMQWAVGTAA